MIRLGPGNLFFRHSVFLVWVLSHPTGLTGGEVVGGSLVFIIPISRTVGACLSFGAVVDELAIVRGGRPSCDGLCSLSVYQNGGRVIVGQSEVGHEIPSQSSCVHWPHWHSPHRRPRG